MLFLFICLTTQDAVVPRLNDMWYERESATTLHCKELTHRAGMSAVSCAIIAAAETIYNFGFVVEEETCMACRAGGMPGGNDIMEVSFAKSAHVNGKEHQIWRCVLNNIVDLHGMYVKELCLPRIKLFSVWYTIGNSANRMTAITPTRCIFYSTQLHHFICRRVSIVLYLTSCLYYQYFFK